MAQYFFDSSALAKVYHPELGTAEVVRICIRNQGPHRRNLEGRCGDVQATTTCAGCGGDFDIFIVTDSHFAAAEEFVIKYGFEYRLRTLDALHMAVAVDLRSQGLVSHFVAADKVIRGVEALELEQFSVVNPENR